MLASCKRMSGQAKEYRKKASRASKNSDLKRMNLMMFEISIKKNIKAEQSFVFDWWTDLSPDDCKLVKPLVGRTILSRSQDRILLHDEERMYFKKMAFDVEVTLHKPDSWIAEYNGASAKAKSEYVLKAEADNSTTLFYKSTIHPTRLLTRLFSPLVQPFVKRIFVSEMKIFINTLEKDFACRKMIE
jgi:hypothetical protein